MTIPLDERRQRLSDEELQIYRNISLSGEELAFRLKQLRGKKSLSGFRPEQSYFGSGFLLYTPTTDRNRVWNEGGQYNLDLNDGWDQKILRGVGPKLSWSRPRRFFSEDYTFETCADEEFIQRYIGDLGFRTEVNFWMHNDQNYTDQHIKELNPQKGDLVMFLYCKYWEPELAGWLGIYEGLLDDKTEWSEELNSHLPASILLRDNQAIGVSSHKHFVQHFLGVVNFNFRTMYGYNTVRSRDIVYHWYFKPSAEFMTERFFVGRESVVKILKELGASPDYFDLLDQVDAT